MEGFCFQSQMCNEKTNKNNLTTFLAQLFTSFLQFLLFPCARVNLCACVCVHTCVSKLIPTVLLLIDISICSIHRSWHLSFLFAYVCIIINTQYKHFFSFFYFKMWSEQMQMFPRLFFFKPKLTAFMKLCSLPINFLLS